MISSANLRKIEEITKEFFQKMTFEVGIELLPQKDQTLPITGGTPDILSTLLIINLETESPQILIGEKGETLLEIQHLLKVILKRKAGIEDPFYIDLDINGYKKKKAAYLKELAKSFAEEAALTKKEKVLPVMPAYERRIIHLELSGRSDVISESIGEEPERRVVIKPHP